MATGNTCSIDRIIAKIDNDFNPDNSDWIPRVGAWCIDAMSQLNCLKTKKQKKKIPVIDGIAMSSSDFGDNVTVYDKNGCKVKKAESVSNGCCNEMLEYNNVDDSPDIKVTPQTVNIVNTHMKKAPNYVKANHINTKYPPRYNVEHYYIGEECEKEKNYVLVDSNKIELNFDTDYIYVETEGVETTNSSTYGCEVPVIPDNGLLIEALSYYCMYKMLTRGYSHPVMNLKASQYGTNPYYMYMQMKDEVKRSVNNSSQSDDDADDAAKMMRSNMFIDMFDTRR